MTIKLLVSLGRRCTVPDINEVEASSPVLGGCLPAFQVLGVPSVACQPTVNVLYAPGVVLTSNGSPGCALSYLIDLHGSFLY